MHALLIDGNWRPAQPALGSFSAVDPGRGEELDGRYPVSGWEDADLALNAAARDAPLLRDTAPAKIADFLDDYAARIEAAADSLCARAHRETGLAIEPRLRSVELPRTCTQLRQAATAVRLRSWCLPTIDRGTGIRSHYAPLAAPVLVFGPNNFPLAFNALSGSDFASAIAARNPVLAKVHPGHPETSRFLAELALAALHAQRLPPASVQMVYQLPPELGLRLAGDARLGALAFTGSRGAGLQLKAAADRAGKPVYVELSSINPVFVLNGAVEQRGAEIADAFCASAGAAAGQFCTSPGILIVSRGAAGDALVQRVRGALRASAAGLLLDRGVLEQVQRRVAQLRASGADVLVDGGPVGPGFAQQPLLFGVDGECFLAHAESLQLETFGPVSLVVRTADDAQMRAIAARLQGQLTGSIYADASDEDAYRAVARILRDKVGRLLNDKMPTGVALSAAMNHGGPFPASGHPGFSAVGMPGAIRRFAALHCYDNVADARLPEDLTDANPGGVWRCVDGHWTQSAID